MKASLVLTASAFWVFASAAHAENRTVSWYQAHPTERATMMRACLDDPGHIGRSPDCVNAEVANNRTTTIEQVPLSPCETQPRLVQFMRHCGAFAVPGGSTP